MFSISAAEIITILVVALIIFGPRRLAEMARQAGKLTSELRKTTDQLRQGLQEELDEVRQPFEDVKRDLQEPLDDLRTDLAAAGKGLQETAEGELRWVDVPDEEQGGDEAAAAGDDVEAAG